MIALLSALLGFAGSLVPKLLDLVQDRTDKKHELQMLEAQAKLDQQRADSNLEMSLANARALQATAVQDSYRADIKASVALGNKRTAAYSATVRPTITYMFFGLYVAVKMAQFVVLMHPSLPWQTAASWAQALVAIWNEEDMALFAAVICFWFGDRSFKPRQ